LVSPKRVVMSRALAVEQPVGHPGAAGTLVLVQFLGERTRNFGDAFDHQVAFFAAFHLGGGHGRQRQAEQKYKRVGVYVVHCGQAKGDGRKLQLKLLLRREPCGYAVIQSKNPKSRVLDLGMLAKAYYRLRRYFFYFALHQSG
jgi:hypothetical protein